jgi:SAM-dependent methyltransferase
MVTQQDRLFHFEDPDDYRRVRDVLDNAGYDDQQVVRTLGVDQNELGHKWTSVLLHRTSGGSPLETLIRLFILDLPVALSDVGRALEPMTTRRWVELGLLETDETRARGTVQLRCYQSFIVAFDFVRRGPGGARPDYVMGISPSSIALAGLTPRLPGSLALDLGTGSGFQAFLAASHMDHVVATDLNPRAVEIASFNTGLNDLTNVECLQGDMFEPVAERKFDLIVSNPPFIIAPDRTHLFLHGRDPVRADDVCARIARTAPRFLAEQGICQFQVNWAIIEGEWRDRLTGWFEDCACDVLILHHAEYTPEEYAEMWIEVEGRENEEFDRAFDRWMAFYRDQKIDGIGAGMITMRRTDQEPSVHIVKAPERMTFSCGDDVLRTLEIAGFLERRSDEELLDEPLRVAPDIRLEQSLQLVDGGWQVEVGRVRRTVGLQFEAAIDAAGARILAVCDGEKPIREVLSDVATSAGAPVDDVVREAGPVIRRMIEQGFLLPDPSS